CARGSLIQYMGWFFDFW
nr:immunoglobulin heavy chain junction region [Macaca mulatta]MOV90802.1 immunoglobulin heavy chain junction region [Macaca mulatta]MOV92014.1 immunoglobulin heavy chain junction region [Macaca mulatta]MOV92019.1 immunoglobulin heavy chain junction region [Macaca mulatta]